MRDTRTLSAVASAFVITLLTIANAAAANGDLRLVEAARSQDGARIRVLLAEHVDVNVRSKAGGRGELPRLGHVASPRRAFRRQEESLVA